MYGKIETNLSINIVFMKKIYYNRKDLKGSEECYFLF